MTDCKGILHPEVVVSSAEVIGNISAYQMPYNVQNALGNWLMLIGQAIVTFNAQQQYCMNGPGPCFGEDVTTQTSAATDQNGSRRTIEERLDDMEKQIIQLQQLVSEQHTSLEWRFLEQLCRNLAVVQPEDNENEFRTSRGASDRV